MSGGKRSDCNPAPAQAQWPLDGAIELLVGLQSKLDALDTGTEETRRIADELRVMIEEVRQALGDAAEGR